MTKANRVRRILSTMRVKDRLGRSGDTSRGSNSISRENPTDSSSQTAPRPSETPEDLKWQRQLLPMMTRTIVYLAVFFFLASLAQLAYLHWKISRSPELDIHEPLSMLSAAAASAPQNNPEIAKLKALIALEANGMEQQYHQANVSLMSRIWTVYLGFVTGMILSLVGASFVLGKLREERSELTLRSAPANVSFRSASPGLILAVLGTILMLTAIVTNHKIYVTHSAVYLGDLSPARTTETAQPPVPDVPPEMKTKN